MDKLSKHLTRKIPGAEIFIAAAVIGIAGIMVSNLQRTIHYAESDVIGSNIVEHVKLTTTIDHLSELRDHLTDYQKADRLSAEQLSAATTLLERAQTQLEYHYQQSQSSETQTILSLTRPLLSDLKALFARNVLTPQSPQLVRFSIDLTNTIQAIKEIHITLTERTVSELNREQSRLQMLVKSSRSELTVLIIFSLLLVAALIRQWRSRHIQEREQTRLHDSIENLSDGLALYDKDDRLLLWNQHFATLMPEHAPLREGMRFEEIVRAMFQKDQQGRRNRLLNSDHQTGSDAAYVANMHRACNDSYELQDRSDRLLLVRESNTSDHGTVSTFTDVSRIKQAESKVRHLYSHDQLTSLANRYHFLSQLDSAITEAKNSGTQLALCDINIDNFTHINNAYGLQRGNSLLRSIGKTLSEQLSENEFVARYEGDEFIVLIKDPRHSPAIKVARQIQTILRHGFTVDGSHQEIHASFGIASYPKDGHDVESLVDAARAACRHAKYTGKNGIRHYAKSLNQENKERSLMEQHLRDAITRGELNIQYQPQFNIQDRTMVGFEALLRWENQVLGRVEPQKFISLAEDTGLIIPLDDWVLEQACLDYLKLNQSLRQHCKLSVNLSRNQFRTGHVLERICQTVEETGINPQQLILEITETAMLDDLKTTINTLEQLHDRGFQLAIDDFGMGQSSFSALMDFPLHKIKIDKCFVSNLETNSRHRKIVASMINMTKSMGICVVAEGVETEEQLYILKEMGCDIIQGYLLARPGNLESLHHYTPSRHHF